MPRYTDLSGQKYGYLTALTPCPQRVKNRGLKWICKCDCGNQSEVYASDLKRGNTKSCGKCRMPQVKHGQAAGEQTRAYRAWQNMLGRCYNAQNPKYPVYGARGITVCDRWRNFENFYTDMGDPPENHTLDRKNTEGNYSLNNCRWSTQKEQQRNRRNNHRISYRNQNKTVAEWAEILEIHPNTLYTRLNCLGWSIEKALDPEHTKSHTKTHS